MVFSEGNLAIGIGLYVNNKFLATSYFVVLVLIAPLKFYPNWM